MVDLETHLRRARKKRWENATQEQKSATMQHASLAYWAKLSPEQRSIEMKRRAAKRKKKPAKTK